MVDSFDAEVIVIGSGLAGLRAAGVLHENGVNIIVLEAQNRIGGRVLTDAKFGFDLGASWFHGTIGNVAYDLSTLGGANLHDANLHDSDVHDNNEDTNEDKDWKTHTHVQYLGGLPPIRVSSNGTRSHVDKQKFYEQLRVLVKASRSPAPCDEEDDISLHRQMERSLPDERPGLLMDCLRLWNSFTESIIGGAVFDHSSKRDDDYLELRGGHVAPPNGMTSAVVEPLSKRIPACKLRLNSPVARVQWEASGTVVTLEDGTQLTAHVVLCTVSVNVLKDLVFDPALPPKKLEAVTFTGLDAVAKAYFMLSEPLDNAEDGCAQCVVWEDGALSSLPVWASGVRIVYYELSASSPPHIIVWLVGEAARNFESSKNRISEAEAVMAQIYGNAVQVTDVLYGGWGRNKWFQGAYSYPRVGAIKERTRDLASPLVVDDELRVAFAGEATHPTFYSTMHGAVESGEREARRCTRYLRGMDRKEWQAVYSTSPL